MSKRRFKSIRILRVRSERPLRRFRQFDREHHAFARRAHVNPRTLRREREFVDERTFWWFATIVVGVLLALTLDSRTMLEAVGTFAIYASINIVWSMVIGTSGVLSMATLAIVGTSGFLGGKLAIELGLPWWCLLIVGALVGGLMGLAIGVPAQRLDGMYYALLTLGVVELCRTYFRQSATFGAASSGLLNVPSFLPSDHLLDVTGARIKVIAALVLLASAVVFYRLIDNRDLGRRLKTMRDSEAFGNAIGIDLVRNRLVLFALSSIALGVIGGFYASYNRTVSASIFDLNLLLLLFAMIVLGGASSAEGVTLGTAIVVFVDKGLIGLGAMRILLVGLAVIVATLLTKQGLYGIPEQYRRWRDKRKSERISASSHRDGDVTIEEAALIADKDQVAARRFVRQYKPELRSLITDEIIAEHRAKPLGQHSADLERLLNYFRKGELAEKYVVLAVKPFEKYRVFALSGERGIPPREVDETYFDTVGEAYHAVFLRRIEDLKETSA